MVSLLVYKRIKDRAKEHKLSVPKNYESIMCRYKKIRNLGKNRIVFSWLFDAGSRVLNASPMIPGLIVLNAEWAAKIVLEDCEDTMNAFMITVGHELTHKDKEVNWVIYTGNNRKFVAQVNEIHADFGAAQKMCGSSRQALLKSIEYKRKNKKADDGDFAHPPWWKRYEYVNEYNFDKTLIRKIADDVNCQNERLINYLICFYDDIVLT